MSEERLYLHQLACEVAFRILTAEQPALALAKFGDDLADEIAAGRANLAGSEALREAFREAMGYSMRVDALEGAADESADRSGRESGAGLANGGAKADGTPGRAAAAPSSALSGRDGDLTATDGPPETDVACPGHTGPSRPPNAPDDDPMVAHATGFSVRLDHAPPGFSVVAGDEIVTSPPRLHVIDGGAA